MRIKAYAKINLTLDICGKRDDGYHLLDSVMQSVSLYDLVTLEIADKIEVRCSQDSLSGEKNIAFKAAKTFFDFVKLNGGVSIFVEKNIPYPAGIGGGSADAAAVICGLNKLYNTNLSMEQLCDIGLKVGADVPFCIVGGTARVQGIGEKITPLKPIKKTYFLLVKNGEKSSTGDMYKKIDDGIISPIFYTSSAVKCLENNDFSSFKTNIGNTFADICGLYRVDELLKETSPDAVSLSGSGPVVFAMYPDKHSAQDAKAFLDKKSITSYFVHSCDTAFSIE
ncbi:MAG: 4-(cytidine 5'-diphospho)-2-C-methyl-D-erythritol kinase [Ruminococcaceae bacterium]|nr:4-(cytidine 5'-diphospho)-2-C-methyl-D-erythritol kinase [Oscillospiraceae bacterium]